MDVCIRTGERERGQLQGGAYRPTKPLNRRGGGKEKNTHTQRACIYQFNWERSSRNNNISSTITETAGFYKISRSIQFRGGERKKNLSISQSRWRRLSRYTKVWVGLILNSPLFFLVERIGGSSTSNPMEYNHEGAPLSRTRPSTQTHTQGKMGKNKQ